MHVDKSVGTDGVTLVHVAGKAIPSMKRHKARNLATVMKERNGVVFDVTRKSRYLRSHGGTG